MVTDDNCVATHSKVAITFPMGPVSKARSRLLVLARQLERQGASLRVASDVGIRYAVKDGMEWHGCARKPDVRESCLMHPCGRTAVTDVRRLRVRAPRTTH